MLRTGKRIYCDNEHGCGEVTFPDDAEHVDFINGTRAQTLRTLAKAAGWTITKTHDLCPGCSESAQGDDPCHS